MSATVLFHTAVSTLLKFIPITVAGLFTKHFYEQYRMSEEEAVLIRDEAHLRLMKKHVQSVEFQMQKVKIQLQLSNKPGKESEYYIHTFMTIPKQSQTAQGGKTIVLLHGWGSAIGMYCKCIDELAKHYDQIYAIDILGWGNSSRPSDTGIEEAEQVQQIWVESLEEWRKNVGLTDQSFDLCGHSLGSFVSASYAAKYSQNISRLIMVSPVGLQEWKPSICEPKSFIDRLAGYYTWGLKQTPQTLLKATGPMAYKAWMLLGSRVSYYGLNSELWDYFFHFQVAKSAGDLLFTRLLTPQGWQLTVGEHLEKLACPVRFILGEDDWINQHAPRELVRKRQHPTDAYYVSNVGHHPYFEMDAEHFTRTIISDHNDNLIFKIDREYQQITIISPHEDDNLSETKAAILGDELSSVEQTNLSSVENTGVTSQHAHTPDVEFAASNNAAVLTF